MEHTLGSNDLHAAMDRAVIPKVPVLTVTGDDSGACIRSTAERRAVTIAHPVTLSSLRHTAPRHSGGATGKALVRERGADPTYPSLKSRIQTVVLL
jgi:hypothetical protein